MYEVSIMFAFHSNSAVFSTFKGTVDELKAAVARRAKEIEAEWGLKEPVKVIELGHTEL